MLFYKVDKSDFLEIAFFAPIANEAIGAVVGADVARSAALTRNTERLEKHCTLRIRLWLFATAIGHHTFQSVHLPYVPRHDIGNAFEGLFPRLLSKFVVVIFNVAHEHRLAGDEQIVALPFVSISVSIRHLCPFEPVARLGGIFAHDAQFAVE